MSRTAIVEWKGKATTWADVLQSLLSEVMVPDHIRPDLRQGRVQFQVQVQVPALVPGGRPSPTQQQVADGLLGESETEEDWTPSRPRSDIRRVRKRERGVWCVVCGVGGRSGSFAANRHSVRIPGGRASWAKDKG
ncbi:hypothetical protein HJFPF1_05008 [Paramyrothecium foliicola]|nr:hypothetical protein HJFPF1_05008 [Paramyrothecium foliicola]